MSIYAKTLACLRQNPVAFLLFAAAFNLLAEASLPMTLLGIGVAVVMACFCHAGLSWFLTGQPLRPRKAAWNVIGPGVFLIVPPLFLGNLLNAQVPEGLDAMTAGAIAYGLVIGCMLVWFAMFGTALPAGVEGAALQPLQDLARARQTAWPMVKALLAGPVLMGTGVMLLTGLALGLSYSGILPEGRLADRALGFVGDMAILIVTLMTLAALAEVWTARIAPPSRAEVFA